MALRDLLTLTAATDALAAFKEQIGHSRLLSNLIVRSVYCRTAGKPSEIDRTEWLETELSVLPYCAIAGTPSYYYMHVVTLAWFLDTC